MSTAIGCVRSASWRPPEACRAVAAGRKPAATARPPARRPSLRRAARDRCLNTSIHLDNNNAANDPGPQRLGRATLAGAERG
jgi:hypothetical protein